MSNVLRPSSDVIIDVKGVTKRFDGKVVVDSLDLNVRRGEIFGFLGPQASLRPALFRLPQNRRHSAYDPARGALDRLQPPSNVHIQKQEHQTYALIYLYFEQMNWYL